MTTTNEPTLGNKIVGKILPWLVAVTGLVIYLATFNHWFSLNNITQTARLTGELPGVELNTPLYFLATYPLHWLPARLVPISLNLFSALCGAVILGLLARSVTLLPHDRTHDQRLREDNEFSLLSIREAWLPPVLAALVLGLQLTFWEAATGGARELLDLLLAAYVLRCVLEYRISERDSWLFRGALVYGAAMTENWVMIALLPLWFGALMWIRGTSFFNLRFLRGLLLCGSIGLLLYLLLPLVHVHSEYRTGTFWQALKVNLKEQKDFVSGVFLPHRGLPWNYLLLLAVTSFLPLLLISVKWASYFGDPSPVGIALTTGIFHLSHGALLGACVWAAFDPAFGPRHMGGVPMLIHVLIYLEALCIGYFAGYFLLVFLPLRERTRYVPFWKTALHRGSQAIIWILLLLVPAGLVLKNGERIKFSNSVAFPLYAEQLSQNLPDRAVVLSDDPIRLLVAKSWLARTGRSQDRIFLGTQFLVLPDYFNKQQKLHPAEWLPAADPKNLQGVDSKTQMELLLKLYEQRPLYYLQPSFGFFFEIFYPVPHGLVMEMRRCDTNSVSPPPLTETEIAENEAFWSTSQSTLHNLLPFITEPPTLTHPTFRQTLLKKFHIVFEPTPIAQLLGAYYSLALNAWGVQAQMANKLPEAGRHFDLALKLSSKNLPARRNLEFNKDLQAGIPTTVQPPKSLEEDFGSARIAQQILREGGPFDDPTHRFGLGVIFGQGQLNRQAAIQFERISAQVPDYLPARIWLAQFYVLNHFPEKALALIPFLREQIATASDPGITKYDILKVEAYALYSSDKSKEAEKILQQAMEKNPTDMNLLFLIFQISTGFKSYTNALHAINLALELTPGDVGALVNKGYLSIQIGDHPAAIAALTAALASDTNNTTAKLNRAIAYLGNNQLDAAQQDYAELENISPNVLQELRISPFQIYYGLGEIAWRKNDTNNAIRYYDLYLRTAGDTSDEGKTISERLQKLHAAPPP